jgi:hypothetical protein
MERLRVGQRVCIKAEIPSFSHCTGGIVAIAEPLVRDIALTASALFELRLYSVRLDDGRSFRFRGRDLEPLRTIKAV